ncbi:MAG: flagellar protein FlaG [Lachnospiraceae bacterium]|nr:flagellar protein FlaG [Lachnospiraceae bacterium]
MAIEPLGSVMLYQAQPAQKQMAPTPIAEAPESATPEQVANVDVTTASVAKVDNKDGKEEQGSSPEQENPKATTEQIKKAVERLNKNMPRSEAVFGIHEKTNRVTIKIVDKETKELIKELPPEKTLDMIAKAWELAGLLVDERR